MAVVLVSVGAAILLLLGIAHAAITLQSTPQGGPMMPTDPVVLEAMGREGGLGIAPQLQSSLFTAWIGFNLSHALGVLVIASVLLYQALDDLAAAVEQPWFLGLALAIPLVYLVIAQFYWFAKPRDAIAIATIFLWAGVLLELL